MINTLNKLSNQNKLGCRKCHAFPVWFKAGQGYDEQDENGSLKGLDVFCGMCGAGNYIETHYYEGGSYDSWNGKRIKAEDV